MSRHLFLKQSYKIFPISLSVRDNGNHILMIKIYDVSLSHSTLLIEKLKQAKLLSHLKESKLGRKSMSCVRETFCRNFSQIIEIIYHTNLLMDVPN